jgi:hypothetical protein
MASERVGDMTRKELEEFVRGVISERSARTAYTQQSDRPISEVLRDMRKNVWTPPPNAKSSFELLREDRDR